jgi:hypothetical protein
MSQTVKLLEVDYHTDDDTGMYVIGEVDFGISDIESYLRSFGIHGRDQILITLSYLAYEVQRTFLRLQDEQKTKGNVA